jgi:protein involved in polysaccharide export with SLBB domain
MTKKLFAVVLLSLTLAACEPGSTDNNSNANNAKPNTNTAASTPAPVSPSPEPSASVKLKAGDKVKVTVNGAATDATVVSVDEKSGKVTVKIQGQKEEKTIAIADVARE